MRELSTARSRRDKPRYSLGLILPQDKAHSYQKLPTQQTHKSAEYIATLSANEHQVSDCGIVRRDGQIT
jgi:hypothetical protein